MSAPAGPRGGPAPPQPLPAPQPEMPDLSHLTEEERKIILAVMDRQKKEEEKEQSVLKVKEEQKPQLTQWFPFSGITELVNNVLQPQQKQQNEKEPQTLKAEPGLPVISIWGIPVPWSQETQLGMLEMQLGFPAAELSWRKFKCWRCASKLPTLFNTTSV